MRIIRIFAILIVLLVVASFIPKYGQVCVGLPDGPCQKTQVWGFGYPVFYGAKFLGDVRMTKFVPAALVANIVLYTAFAVAIDYAAFSRKRRTSQ